jgi:hypothetical protein
VHTLIEFNRSLVILTQPLWLSMQIFYKPMNDATVTKQWCLNVFLIYYTVELICAAACSCVVFACDFIGIFVAHQKNGSLWPVHI